MNDRLTKWGIRMRRNNHQMLPYVWCLPYLFNKNIYEAGCNKGFGSILLSFQVNSIDAADIDPRFLNIAKNNEYLCPITFQQKDFNSDPINFKYDAILAFEILDHLDNPKFFLENVVDCCDEFFFSLPHMMPEAEHKVLYDFEKAKALVEPYFDVKWYFEKDNIITTEPGPSVFRYLGHATPK